MTKRYPARVVPFSATRAGQPDPQLIIQRLPHESRDDWQRLLKEIETFGHATVIRLSADSVGLRWDRAEGAA